MARIQPIAAQRSFDIGSVPNTRVDDSIGQGLQQLGGALSRAGAVEAAIEDRRLHAQMQMEEFRTDQSFRRFQDDNALDYVKTEQEIDPSGEGFTAKVSGDFNAKSAEFLETVPDALKPKFSELVATAREGWINKAAAAEVDQRHNWYRTGIAEAHEKLQTNVFNDPELYDAALQDGNRAIDTSGLPATEKETLRKAWEETLALTLGERETRDAEADPASATGSAQRLGVTGVSSSTDNGGDAMSLLREFEGFRATPYWDVNANRVGYGSDTVTRADGSVVKVTKGMRVSRADAERDLARRVKEFEATARKQVGARAWGALPANTQAALVSVAYNYGSLPARVSNAVREGNIEGIASAVAGLSGDNGGINAKRRQKEAAIIRGGTIGDNRPDLSGDGMDDRYQPLSLSQRLELYDNIQAAAKRGTTAINAQAKVAYDQHKGALDLGIETGEVGSERTILDDAVLRDDDKATLLRRFRDRRKEAIATDQAVELFHGGQLRVDPYSSDGKKTVDNVWKELSKTTPPDQLQASTEELVRQTGAVPQPVVNLIRRGLTSTNVEDIVQAAQAAQRLATVDPAALARRDGGSEAQKAADDFGFYVNTLNLSPEDAAKRMAEANRPEAQRERKALEPAAKEFRKEMEDEDVGAIFGSWFSSPDVGFSPKQELGIKAEFLAIAEDQFYASNGDPAIARNRAVETMKRLYGVTNVTGRAVVTKHPPENHWPKFRLERYGETSFMGDTPSLDYARIQLERDIRQFDPNVDMNKVQLVTTKKTDAEVKRGEMPGYVVMWTDENGLEQAIPGRHWRPDIEAVQQQQAEDDLRRAEEAESNARRLQQMERQEIQRRQIIDQRQRETGQRLRGGTVLPEIRVTPQSRRENLNDQRQQIRQDAIDSGALGFGAMP